MATKKHKVHAHWGFLDPDDPGTLKVGLTVRFDLGNAVIAGFIPMTPQELTQLIMDIHKAIREHHEGFTTNLAS